MKLNIQLFAGGTITGTSTASVGRVQIVWTATASDAIENKSSVHADVQVKRSNAYNTTGTFSGTLWINGVATSIKKKFDPLSNSWKTIGGATIDVPHNEDGTKTIEIKTSFSNTGTSMAGTYTASANVQLDTIARASAFNTFTMSVNNDSSISVVASITKRNTSFTDTLNICNENITLNNGTNYITFSSSSHATAYNRFYEIMGTQTQANYTAVLTTSSSGSQIGNTSALTAYNVALPNYAISIGTITSSDDNANNYIRSGSTHKVSDFTSANTFLQGWSNPRLSYSLGATYNVLYGRSINITGATTRSNLGLGADSFTLGTSFTGGTKTLNASDGRKSASNSITLTRKDWATPSVSITLTRESATGTQINWSVSWTYTNVSGGITPKLNASYTYNGTTTALISDRTLTSTSGTLTGSFNLTNADDYKYPISAGARINDMIDYQVTAPFSMPGGLPAIYVHKDSSANNLVDIYGKLTSKGEIIGVLDNSNCQFRAVQGNYGAMIRNDGSDTYLLLTNSGDQYGRWNTLRPLAISNGSGYVTIGNGASISGSLTINGNTTTNGVLTIVDQGTTQTIGDGSYGYCHYNTTGSNGHWFNNTVRVMGDVYAGSGYNRRLMYADEMSDTGWQNITSIYGGAWEYAQVRKIGKIVHLRARASSFAHNGTSSILAFNIPAGYRPSKLEYAYGFVPGQRISRWYIATDGNAGMDWAINISNGGAYTSTGWTEIDTTWYVD